MVDVRFIEYGSWLNGDYGYGTVMYLPPVDGPTFGPSMSYMMVF
jgi:hypothetical protein